MVAEKVKVEKRPDRTLGGVHEEFWKFTAKGELRIQECNKCHRRFWPPVPACDNCGSTDIAWNKVSGKGKIISFCTFEKQYYQELAPPWDVIVVELEEGPIFLSNPLGFTWKDITKDMKVKVSFVACEDKHGQFKLPVFEKA